MKNMVALLVAMLLSATLAAQEQGSVSEVFFPQQLSARELLVHCAASPLTDRGRQRLRYCSGFVSGVEEAVRWLMQGSLSPAYRFCIPPREPARHFRDAYVRYAGRHTTSLDRPASLVVIEALANAYPCRG
jgi:hypothetical protein